MNGGDFRQCKQMCKRILANNHRPSYSRTMLRMIKLWLGSARMVLASERARSSVWTYGPMLIRVTVATAWTAVGLKLGLIKRHPRWLQRFGRCLECRLYYKPLGTCGYYFGTEAQSMWWNPVTKVKEPAGCLCPMWFKVLIPDETYREGGVVRTAPRVECWMAERTDGKVDGWKV